MRESLDVYESQSLDALRSVIHLIVALLSVNAVHAVEVTATISLGNYGGYYGLAYDSGKGEIFIANGDFDSVSVISDNNNTVVATIPVGRVPDGAAYDSAKGNLCC